MKPFRTLITFALALVLCLAMTLNIPKPLWKFVAAFPNGTAVVYCRQSSCGGTDVGNGTLVQCEVGSLQQILPLCGKVDGVSVKFGGTKTDYIRLQRLFRLSVSDEFCCGGTLSVCGYSPVVQGGVFVGGKKINLQLAFDGQTVTVGSPLILDSY